MKGEAIMVNKLIFKDAEDAKFAIMASQQKEIVKLYEDWADEIGERAKYYSHKSTASAPMSERYYRELQKQLRQTSQEVSNEIYKKIKSNIYTVADAVVSDNVKWLESFGFSSDGLNAAFSYVPHEIVQNLVTGQIYDSGWSLSSRIWGDNEQTLKDIYQVMAKGLAENKPIYEIAKDLESYVRPSAKLPWNLRMADGKKIYKKQVDYNAQRLARTLVQHGYQQSFIATTQKNPFITEYVWRSNGSRVCDLCKARDGVHYKKTELPMDHPNGMCTMEPVVADDMIDQLADWFNSPDGTYPEIDAFAGKFGYEASKTDVNAIKDKFTEAGFKRIIGSHDYKSDARACNPRALVDDEHNYEYWQNCSHTVPTYEMRRRGYDVTATGALNNDKFKKVGMRAWGYKDHDEAYKAGAVNYVNTKRSNKIANEIAQALIDAGDGARFEIRAGWKTGGGHFFVCENVNGEVVFIDPQSGDVGDTIKDYLLDSKPSTTWYTRIDNIELDPKIMKELMR